MSQRAWDAAWEVWFNSQYDLTRAIDALLNERLADKPGPFRVAVHAAVIEHVAERMRADIDLPDTPAGSGR